MTTRHRRLALLSLAVLTLAGCMRMPEAHPPQLTADRVADPRQMHPITVLPRRETLTVTTRGMEIGFYDAARISAFIDGFVRNRGNVLLVSAAPGTPGVAAVVALARMSGLPDTEIVVGTQAAPDELSLSYEHIAAVALPCDGPGTQTPDWGNGASPTFGCATQKNLAAMVADPMDLLGPGRVDPRDAERATFLMRSWRELPFVYPELTLGADTAPGGDAGGEE